MVAVSSCITGLKCRYNATDTYNSAVMSIVADNYIAVCPELLAGLGTPRSACEIVGGDGANVLNGTARIIDEKGIDITEIMIEGAEKALQICLKYKITKAYLQAKSPTCGCGKIYDGTFSKTLKFGDGILTALLNQHGVEVVEVE